MVPRSTGIRLEYKDPLPSGIGNTQAQNNPKMKNVAGKQGKETACIYDGGIIVLVHLLGSSCGVVLMKATL